MLLLKLCLLVLILAKMNALGHQDQCLGRLAALTLDSVHLKPLASPGKLLLQSFEVACHRLGWHMARFSKDSEK